MATKILLLLAIIPLLHQSIQGILIQRSPGSNRINVRLQVPPNSEGGGIIFTALLPNADCLTEEPTENRLFLDLPGCRLSLDWSNSLFGTTHYYRRSAAAQPTHLRVRRKWRVGPVQKLKMGSAIIHYGNNMRVQIDDTGLTSSSVAPGGSLMGPQQHKAFACPLALASTGNILDVDIFAPAASAKCQMAVEFGPEYRVLSSEEKEEANGGDGKAVALEQEAMKD